MEQRICRWASQKIITAGIFSSKDLLNIGLQFRINGSINEIDSPLSTLNRIFAVFYVTPPLNLFHLQIP